MSARANKVAVHKKEARKIAALFGFGTGASAGENEFQKAGMAASLGCDGVRIGRAARLASDVEMAGRTDAASGRNVHESIDFIGFYAGCVVADAVCMVPSASGSSADAGQIERVEGAGGGVVVCGGATESDASERTRNFGQGISSPLPLSVFDDSAAFPVRILQKNGAAARLDAMLAEKMADSHLFSLGILS